MAIKYRCRNDFVLFKLVDRGTVRGVHVPQVSAQGKERIVMDIGPDVEDLDVGYKVMVIGTVGMDVVQLPNETNLFLTKQANVTLIVEEEEDEEDPFEAESSKAG